MNKEFLIAILINFSSFSMQLGAQTTMLNPYGREGAISLNGKWQAILDPFCRGEFAGIYKNKKQSEGKELIEYSFEDGFRLNVPGDFNSQLPELNFYEGNVWYHTTFQSEAQTDKRQFLYFAAVNYQSAVWLNGAEIGRHEGGFLPFQFEISSKLKKGENDLVVLVNNDRRADGIPGINYDWWNYGGITRDVFLIETNSVYILDYNLQLKKELANTLSGFVKLDGAQSAQAVEIIIPELKIKKSFTTDNQGYVTFEIPVKL